jgi:hypothetical protein
MIYQVEIHPSIIFILSCELIHFSVSSLDVAPIQIHEAQNLFDGSLFIISNGTYLIEKIPKEYQFPVHLLTQFFNGLIELDKKPEQIFCDLIKTYEELYHIDLHIIAFINEQYIMIDKQNYLKLNEEQSSCEKHAFLFTNIQNTMCYPLYIDNNNGDMQTIFMANERFIWPWIEEFINQKNQNSKL